MWKILLAFFCSVVSASVLNPNYNETTFFSLVDGDSVVLSGFPANWKYNRIYVGINGNSLRGTFLSQRDSCEISLSGYYQKLDFLYAGDSALVLIYRGKLPIIGFLQWWVDNGLQESECQRSETDSSAAENLPDEIQKTLDFYTALDSPNVLTPFTNSVGSFQISRFPSYPHNDILVQIESADGRELDGFFRINDQFQSLTGYSTTIVLNRRSVYAVAFQIAFPGVRSYTVKWWAESRTVKRNFIESFVQDQGDSLMVHYSFIEDRGGDDTLALKFLKESFVDGLPPSFQKFSALPTEIVSHFQEGIFYGSLYEISGNLKSGEKVTIAIPLEFTYNQDDSLGIYHFHDGIWGTVAIDSVSKGFIYFQTDSFSLFGSFVKKSWNAIKRIGKVFSAAVDAVQAVVSFANDLYRKLTNFICGGFLDRDMWKRLLGLETSATRNFNVGEISTASHPYLNESFLELEAQSPLKILDSSEIVKLKKTSTNLNILLADLLARKRGLKATSRFSFSLSDPAKQLFELKDGDSVLPFKDYFLLSSDLTNLADELLDLLVNCYGAVNLTGMLKTSYKNVKEGSAWNYCKNYFNMWGFSTWYQSVFECGSGGLKDFSDGTLFKMKNFLDKKDDYVLQTSEVLSRVALLAYYSEDPTTKEALGILFNQTYKSLSSWVGFMGSVMLYNNISIKAEAALALYEYIYEGTLEHFNLLKLGFQNHYGSSGGFSEGMGYAEYINETVPYLLIALRQAMQFNGDDFSLPENYLKSGKYMATFSRPVRIGNSSQLIPVEVDDGCTFAPDFISWGTLNKDKIFFDLAKRYPGDTSNSRGLLSYFGLPDARTQKEILAAATSETASPSICASDSVWAGYQDGVGIIKVYSPSDTASLSINAENGLMRTMGQAHDQQDNMSFTLASSRYGFLIQDRGYEGFSAEKGYKTYESHNVITQKCQARTDCDSDDAAGEALSVHELSARATAFTGYNTGAGMYLLFDTIKDKLGGYGVKNAGGSDAVIKDSLCALDSRQSKIIGYTFSQKTTGGLALERSIIYFGNTLWLVDQNPEGGDPVWNANIPKTANVSRMKFFNGRIEYPLLNSPTISWKQNGTRGDYKSDSLLLAQNTISLSNSLAVLFYPIGESAQFQMVFDCPENLQCFEKVENSKTWRIVIAPRNQLFVVSNAFPGIKSADILSGVVFGEKDSSENWNIYGPLNGTFVHNNVDKESVVDLPALRILLDVWP